MIADDEAHICRLIQALVDWQSLGMEVVGVASNGIEAIDLVDGLHPDILITDIRMPGCNGLELIQHVKTANANLEVIIISGYAHFPYAQTAMKYGVGNYLLKPINKAELIQTLQKLVVKVRERMESESGLEKLIQIEKSSKQKMKNHFMSDILDDKIPNISIPELGAEYGLNMQDGILQIFCIKMDYEGDKITERTLQVVQEKAQNIVAANLQSLCYEYVFMMDEHWGYGVLNYESKKQDDVRRVIRYCLNQLVIQKGIWGPITFTFTIDEWVKHPQELGKSLQCCKEMMKERITQGRERIIEYVPKECGLKGVNLLEGYSRIISTALETISIEEGGKAISFLKDSAMGMKNIRGYEVLDLLTQAGSLFLMQVEMNDKNELKEAYTQKCEQSGSMSQLFEQLRELQETVIQKLQAERDSDILRPIRMAKKYIQNHYQEQITLEEVSDVVGLSSSYFSGLFKKETGEGFAKYLINIRVEAAKVLLRETNTSVSVICKEVGYNDLKHFTHTFEKATGLKPGAYRKLYG